MKTVSFRLSESDVELLEQLAEQHGVSKTQYIRDALQNAVATGEDAVHVNTENEQPEVVAALIRQLDQQNVQLQEKDKQLERLGASVENLTQALQDAQKVAGQAQTLHYAEQQTLPARGSAEAAPSAWDRFKTWLKGE